jgi:hypothetical protein
MFISNQLPLHNLKAVVYVIAYLQTIRTHLDVPGKVIRDWLVQLRLEDAKNLP